MSNPNSGMQLDNRVLQLERLVADMQKFMMAMRRECQRSGKG